MKIHVFCNLKLKIDLVGILSKTSLRDELVRSIYKFVKLVTKINSKVHKSKTYNKIINNPIYENKKCKAVKKKL